MQMSALQGCYSPLLQSRFLGHSKYAHVKFLLECHQNENIIKHKTKAVLETTGNRN